MRRIGPLLVGAVAMVLALASVAQPALVVRPLAERKVADLPSGELFWRIETYPSKVSSSGASDLRSLVMFVVDATQPFSSPASLP